MKMKATKFSLLGILSFLLIFTACQDDFTEEDLLRLQAELAETAATNDQARELALLAQMQVDALALEEARAENAADAQRLSDEIQRAYQEFLFEMDQMEDDARREKALEMLTAAGLVNSYTIVVSGGDQVLDGSIVTLANGMGTSTDTTDASGTVVFDMVPTGFSTISVSATNHLGLSYRVRFDPAQDNLQTVYIDGQNVTVVEPNEASSIVRLLNTTAGSQLATIKGRVYGHSDLTTSETDDFPGVPVKAVLKTNFGGENESDLVTWNSANNSLQVQEIFFAEETGFGMDTTNAEGEYSMVVPAAPDLYLDYRVTFPERFTLNQTLAAIVNDSASIVSVAATYGPNVNLQSTPQVYGYQVNVDNPAATGTGYALSNILLVERDINDASEDWNTFFNNMGGNIGERVDLGGLQTIATPLVAPSGSFTATPSVTATGGTSTAVFKVENTWDITNSIDLSAGTAGRYNASVNVADVYIYVIGSFYADPSDIDTLRIDVGNVVSQADGSVTAVTGAYTPAGFWTWQLSDDAGGWFNYWTESMDAFQPEDNVSFRVNSISAAVGNEAGYGQVADAAIAGPAATLAAGSSGSFDRIELYDAGDGFTSAPTFNYSGWTGGTPPNFTINEFPIRYAFRVASNSDWSYVPTDLEFTAKDYVTDVNTTQDTKFESVWNVLQSDSGNYLVQKDLAEHLTISGGSLDDFNDSTAYYVTNDYLHESPTAVDPGSNLNPLQITGIQIDETNGRFTGVVIKTNEMDGYTSIPQISISPRTLASTSLAMDLSPSEAFVFEKDIYENWNRDLRIDERSKQIENYFSTGGSWYYGSNGSWEGSGYNYYLNDYTGTGGSWGVDYDMNNLQPGEVYTRDMYYGSGERDSDVEGDTQFNTGDYLIVKYQ
ncbi:MAG: hypothetical protein JXQ90_10650 [Cyclobacteriaceae bacterium]